MYIEELSETRKKELEIRFEKEINDYQNKIICKEKFIYSIKKCNIMEFCYLYQTYIGKIEAIYRMPDFTLDDNNLIETTNDDYIAIQQFQKHSKKYIKKLVRIEKMAQKKYKIN